MVVNSFFSLKMRMPERLVRAVLSCASDGAVNEIVALSAADASGVTTISCTVLGTFGDVMPSIEKFSRYILYPAFSLKQCRAT